MAETSYIRLQIIVFGLVAASFTNVYITQPVLPVLQQEFGVDIVLVSFSVSAVILGIAISNLPFGFLADRFSIQPIIGFGGLFVAAGGLVCAATNDLGVLLAARFFQGLFIPALTTCLAAYLAKTLPAHRLNVVMGSYVSATVLGGMGGRLLGGWIHPPLHWRYAFVSAAILIIIACVFAMRFLPQGKSTPDDDQGKVGYLDLLKRWELVRIYLCSAGSFALFSSIFNYLPFRLAAEPFNFSTELTTLLYLVYIVGIFMGPLSGRISNRYGSGFTFISGACALGLSLILIALPSVLSIVFGLLGLCGSFFTIHAAAIGSLNRRLSGGHGRANALYVLFYYLGGWFGITGFGYIFKEGGWSTMLTCGAFFLLFSLSAGIEELRERKSNIMSVG